MLGSYVLIEKVKFIHTCHRIHHMKIGVRQWVLVAQWLDYNTKTKQKKRLMSPHLSGTTQLYQGSRPPSLHKWLCISPWTYLPQQHNVNFYNFGALYSALGPRPR